ncbi:glycosyltransferase [Paenibacillus sp. LjRoot153]|uniref:glycosyltransferase n=1 Tax=Paenibacillus sp. LjRoot153 TaxID=3342270 RepID=UPI003ECFC528
MKIKIVYFHVTGDLYGSSRSLISVIKGLEMEKYEPIVILPEAGELVSELEGLGAKVLIRHDLLILRRKTFVNFVSLLMFVNHFFLSIPKLYGLLKQEKVSIIHSNSAIIMSGAIVAKLLKVPHIWHMREVFDDFPKLLWNMYRYLIFHLSTKIICISTDVCKRFESYLDREKFVTIFNGIEEDYISELDQRMSREEMRDRLQIPRDAVVIGNVARISKWKGQDLLIKSFATCKKPLNTYLVLAGDCFPGNENVLDELKLLVKDLQLEDRVIFAGFISDSRNVYVAIDVFVLASTTPEPFGRVLIESMYCGLPSIATNWGGPVDIITHGEDGLLVGANEAAMSECIERLLVDDIQMKQLGRSAKETIRTRFLVHTTVHSIKQEYQSVLGAKDGHQGKRQISAKLKESVD